MEDINLFIPSHDVLDPEISIVVPALNEALTIGMFVDWCKEGLSQADVSGEILIVDSSTDLTSDIALARGARVLKTPRRGLGRAYIDSIPFIRGKYVIMGDSDCTYDFRDLKNFVKEFRRGSEFVMGSRFRGYIEPGAMPPLHRYLGTPITTSILNIIYGSKFSDIHCGMRGLSKNGLVRMDLQSQSWEYASEMVLKSVHLNLKTSEVPIRFLKDQEGRLSHHKRSGWWSPWKAAWINLKAMFIYGADFFLFKPSFVLIFLGLLLAVPLSLGPLTVGAITFSLNWMLLGIVLAILGFQCFYMGILAKVFYDHSGKVSKKWVMFFSYNRSTILSIVVFCLGLIFAGRLVCDYIASGYKLSLSKNSPVYLSLMGLFLMIASFMNFTFTLVLHAANLTRKKFS